MPAFIFYLLFPFVLLGQHLLDFSNSAENKNVDYNSLYPAIILKHEIGKFYKLPKNPVLKPSRSGWDSEDTADPFVHVTADSIYLFYDGSNDIKYSIGYAVRDKDGWGWIKRNQILKPDDEPWRIFHLIAPTVIPQKELLIYNGNSRDSELGYQMGLAAYVKKNWQFKSKNSVLRSGSNDWDFAGQAYQDIVYLPDQNKYKMWYSGFTGPLVSIGLAESNDGLQWEKTGNDPVLKSAPGAIAPDVIFNGQKFTMYYTQLDLKHGTRTFINSAVSEDGINWHSFKTVLKPQSRWEGRRLMRPNLSYFENQYHLFYCAQQGSKWRIGEAIANASFKLSGHWISKPLKAAYNQITIKFEEPPQSRLRIIIINSQNKKPYELNLKANAVSLRKNVFKTIKKHDIPAGTQIEILMHTENQNISPIIYNLTLSKS